MRKYPNFPFLAPFSKTGGATIPSFFKQPLFMAGNIVLKFHDDPSTRTKVIQ